MREIDQERAKRAQNALILNFTEFRLRERLPAAIENDGIIIHPHEATLSDLPLNLFFTYPPLLDQTDFSNQNATFQYCVSLLNTQYQVKEGEPKTSQRDLFEAWAELLNNTNGSISEDWRRYNRKTFGQMLFAAAAINRDVAVAEQAEHREKIKVFSNSPTYSAQGDELRKLHRNLLRVETAKADFYTRLLDYYACEFKEAQKAETHSLGKDDFDRLAQLGQNMRREMGEARICNWQSQLRIASAVQAPVVPGVEGKGRVAAPREPQR